ncbi:hypothetical protein M422DRAFT_48247 [Sphaerobolus stellatus SS14]|uniref:BPL/LPL catalytic domain-containing protein n=1 Tax=Sphaerobolus stellatus (strain SS14) TaxID=990650 RepID=A0A0C9VVV8_SPHS4|nr:hypothetical protein M422DRAFT_48247 [Sphaerobolus stellatus SS14]
MRQKSQKKLKDCIDQEPTLFLPNEMDKQHIMDQDKSWDIRYSISVGCISLAQYICKIQTSMKRHLLENYGIQSTESDNTGVFLSSTRKIGSIGVQVRHRLTNHGLAYNVTPEPLKWFDQVVACGLTDVKAACISEAAGRDVSVKDDLTAFIPVISRVFDRE